MSKKSAQWITIPEASLHTPISEGAKAPKPKEGNPDLVKNKLFWGIGFMVVLVAAFAVMSPSQFSKLLQGNALFDTSGVSGEQTSGVIPPLSLIGKQGEETKQSGSAANPPAGQGSSDSGSVASQGSSDTGSADMGSSASDSASQETLNPAAPAAPSDSPDASQTDPIVKSQDQPMDVAVELISTPEPIVVEPIVTGPVDCKSDMACLLPKLVDCSLAKGLYAYQALGQIVEANLEITGAEGANCLVKAVIAKAPLADAVGKDAVCKLPKGVYTQESLQARFSDPSKLSEVCSGSAVDLLKGFLTPVAVDPQADLVAQLKRQVEELQAQKDQSNKLMLDLVNEVQIQKGNGIYPSAPGAVGGTGLPTGMGTQPNTVQPGFRANPYRVTVTPEQVLQQRLSGAPASAYGSTGSGYSNAVAQTSNAQGYQNVNTQGGQSAYYQGSQAAPAGTLVKGTKTPQTGPETTTIVLLAAFVALVSRKFMRMFAK